MRTRPGALALASLLLLGALSACSDDDADDAGQWSVRGALDELPRGIAEDGLWVVTADLDGALKAGGLTRSGDDLDWLAALGAMPVDGRTAPVFVPIGTGFNVPYAASGEFAEQAGWSVHDVESFVEAGRPPNVLTVASGDFDEDTLNKDLIEVADGIVSNSDADDRHTDLENADGFSPLGQPIRLSEEDGRIALSTSTPLVQAWREGEDTLADDDRAVDLAIALDDEDVLSAVLSEPLDSSTLRGARPGRIADLLIEQSFDGVGIGWSVDDGEPEIHVAYHFENERDASAAIEPLTALWRDGSALRDGRPYAERFAVSDVEKDDAVVRISLELQADNSPQLIFQMLESGEPVFASR